MIVDDDPLPIRVEFLENGTEPSIKSFQILGFVISRGDYGNAGRIVKCSHRALLFDFCETLPRLFVFLMIEGEVTAHSSSRWNRMDDHGT